MGITFHRADFLVASPQLYGEVDGLLGDNFLSFADVEFDLANGAIRMFKPLGCSSQSVLAYWAPASGVAGVDIEPAEAPNFKIVVRVQVNGHSMRAILDSGAGRSFITRVAAKEAGVTPADAGARPGGAGGGIGRNRFDTWIATFKSFKIGQEEIKNAQLSIGDTDVPSADMLLGADFLLSHRVYVANSEHKLYFTYIGGPVFNLNQDDRPTPDPSTAAAAPVASGAPPIPGAPTDNPTDAAGYSRRAAAFVARHDYAAAIADYTKATQLEPQVAEHFYSRGVAHFANHEPALAGADFDQALKLKPDDSETLLARAELRLTSKDVAGGRADIDAATRLDPSRRLTAGAMLTHADLFEPAVAEFDAWLASNPSDVNRAAALNGRCWARALWGQDLDKALNDCNAALDLYPHLYPVLDSRGLVKLRLGRLKEAIADYDAVLRQEPKTPWSLYGRGVAELRMGETGAGQADIAAATVIDANLPEKAKGYGIAP
jgi:tetratricopeptide (TPR) repeat protein